MQLTDCKVDGLGLDSTVGLILGLILMGVLLGLLGLIDGYVVGGATAP